MNKKIFSFLICFYSFFAEANVEHTSFSNEDFTIQNLPAEWMNVNVSTKNELLLALQPKTKKSSFTVREYANAKPSLKQNVAAWLGDYRSFGFKIISNRPVKLDAQTYGYFIEAIHSKSQKVFKQYMSIKHKKLAVLTCHSDKKGSEFNECSEGMMSFSWRKNQ